MQLFIIRIIIVTFTIHALLKFHLFPQSVDKTVDNTTWLLKMFIKCGIPPNVNLLLLDNNKLQYTHIAV